MHSLTRPFPMKHKCLIRCKHFIFEVCSVPHSLSDVVNPFVMLFLEFSLNLEKSKMGDCMSKPDLNIQFQLSEGMQGSLFSTCYQPNLYQIMSQEHSQFFPL